MGLSYTSLLNTSPNLHFCTFYFWFKSSPYRKILVMCKQSGHGFWSSNLQCLCSTKSSCLKNFWRCYYLWFFPPIKHPGYTYAPGRTPCTSAIGYFHDKTKISTDFLRVDYYLPLKYSTRRQWTLLPSTWAKSLTKFNLKMQDFKRVLDLNCE